MYLVLILFIMSFLTFGAWRITQQKNSMYQVAHLEFKMLVQHELLNAGAAYALDFYRAHIHGIGYSQHVAKTTYKEYQFVCHYSSISSEGAELVVEVYEKQKNKGVYTYRIEVKSGKFWCVRT